MKKNLAVMPMVTVMLAVFGVSQAQAEMCANRKTGQVFSRAACKVTEVAVPGTPGPMGPAGPAGLAALNYTPCQQAIVGSWAAYLADANYGSLEYCHVNVSSELKTSGWCRLITNKNAIIQLTGGTVNSAPVNEDNQASLNCKVNGGFFFENGVSAVIDSVSTPDKNSLLGIYWNSAKLQGSFSATRLVNQ
jgi:hypothetical protein